MPPVSTSTGLLFRSPCRIPGPRGAGYFHGAAWARPRVLHGMPIRDLWAPPQLGRLPTRVAMYFPIPSTAAWPVLSSTGLTPLHSPTQSALSSSLFCLQFFLLLLSLTPSSTLSSHRFGSSSLPPPFPHCNSLFAASSPIHLRLPRCLLACSAPPHIHSACEHIAHRFCFAAFGRPTPVSPYPRIHVSLRNGVLARPPSTCLHNIHRHRFGLPFIWWTDIHRPIRFMYQCTFNILAYPSSLSTVISLDAFVLSTVVAGALSYPACFCFAKGTQRSSERKNCAQIPREIQIALSASATYALAPCLSSHADADGHTTKRTTPLRPTPASGPLSSTPPSMH
ncbi:hypothetical protein B0H14DRAFT_3076908, partial [Mycena olivaceomarginata]